MRITIQTVGFTATEKLNDYIHDKVEKLFHQSPEIIRIDVSMKEGAKKNPINKWCSLYVSHPGENHFVKRSSETYEKSVVLSVEAMKKILRRKKTKKVNQRNDPQ